jgi:molybdopterin/thiamine biosynthesis adenylyltransferase
MKSVNVVGIGALGSHTLQFIRGTHLYLKAVDFDRVEQKNTASQFHGKTHIGKLKAHSIEQMMNFVWGVKVHANSARLVQSNIEEIIGFDEESLVVDCLDNGTSRRVLQDHVRKHNLPCVHGALAANAMFGRVVWDKDFQIEEAEGKATCEGGEHLPFIAVVSALLADAIQEWGKSGKHKGFMISPGGVTRI